MFLYNLKAEMNFWKIANAEDKTHGVMQHFVIRWTIVHIFTPYSSVDRKYSGRQITLHSEVTRTN